MTQSGLRPAPTVREAATAERIRGLLPPVLARYGLRGPRSVAVRLTREVVGVRLVFDQRVPGYAADEIKELVRRELAPASRYPAAVVITVCAQRHPG